VVELPDSPVELLGVAFRNLRELPWWMWCCAVIWAGLLVSWLPTIQDLDTTDTAIPPSTARTVLIWLVAAALGWTVLWGALLGHRRAWPVLLLSAPVSTALLMACYVAAMLISPPADTQGGASPDNDNAAGVGLVVFAIPTLLGMGLLLALGAGLGWCTGHLRASRRPAALDGPVSGA
jgi:hypothetical protein